MRKCFVDVGLVKNTEGNYTKYTNHRRGTIIKKADVDGATCLGEVAAELEMVQRAAGGVIKYASRKSTGGTEGSSVGGCAPTPLAKYHSDSTGSESR